MTTVSFIVNDDLAGELRERLREGVVTFIYKKESTGEPRLAHGTTCPSLFSYEFKGKPSHDPRRINYYDLDRDGWRCLLSDNLVGIVPPTPSEPGRLAALATPSEPGRLAALATPSEPGGLTALATLPEPSGLAALATLPEPSGLAALATLPEPSGLAALATPSEPGRLTALVTLPHPAKQVRRGCSEGLEVDPRRVAAGHRSIYCGNPSGVELLPTSAHPPLTSRFASRMSEG